MWLIVLWACKICNQWDCMLQCGDWQRVYIICRMTQACWGSNVCSVLSMYMEKRYIKIKQYYLPNRHSIWVLLNAVYTFLTTKSSVFKIKQKLSTPSEEISISFNQGQYYSSGCIISFICKQSHRNNILKYLCMCNKHYVLSKPTI